MSEFGSVFAKNTMVMEEIWKPVVGYEGMYEVSNLGRVKSLNYKRTGKEQIIDGSVDKKDYIRFALYKHKRRKIITGHKLVALAFIPNQENKSEIHHIDGNPSNNAVDNLMLVTPEEHKALHKEEHILKVSKPVYQYTLDGEFVKEWASLSEIHRVLKYSVSAISSCCLGNALTNYNFQWSYEKTDRLNPIKTRRERQGEKLKGCFNNKLKSKPVTQKTKDDQIIKVWPSICEIKRQLGFHTSNIVKCCKNQIKTAYGYVWSYA